MVFSFVAWLLIKATLGLRVGLEEELRGLDIGEHGMEAYSGFVKESDVLFGGASGGISGSGEVSGIEQ